MLSGSSSNLRNMALPALDIIDINHLESQIEDAFK